MGLPFLKFHTLQPSERLINSGVLKLQTNSPALKDSLGKEQGQSEMLQLWECGHKMLTGWRAKLFGLTTISIAALKQIL